MNNYYLGRITCWLDSFK